MKKITILQTSDTHGYLTNKSYQTNEEVPYGLNKAASFIKQVKKENDTVLIDTGDTIQGSPLMYFYTNHMDQYENPVSAVFNEISYDYVIPGNHDFNYGRTYLEDFIKNTNSKFLCANILRDGISFVDAPYDIKTFDDGLKIAIIGLTTNYIPVWEKAEHIDDLVFADAVEVTKAAIKEIKQQHDVSLIIVGYHGGFERNIETNEIESTTIENVGMKLIDEIPEIDIILSGHQHRVISTKVKDTYISQPGANAAYVTKIDVTFEKEEKWLVKDIINKLVSTAPFMADETINEMLEPIVKDNDVFLDEIIGTNKSNDLEVKDALLSRLHKHKIVDLINTVQLEASGADISCVALGNTSSGFGKEISIRNVLNTYVYPNTLVVVEITGEKLKLALEKNANFFDIRDGEIIISESYKKPKLEFYNYDMFNGINYTIDVRNTNGKRITSLEYKGQPLKNNDTLTLVMSSYRFSGGGEFEMYDGLKVVKEIPLDISELIIDYVKRVKKIEVTPESNITVTYK